MDRRGIHVMFTGRSHLPAMERLLGEVAPALGLNWVIAEVNGSFKYASHPEAAEPDSITRDDARALVKLAKANGITLVPMYNCLGHQSWREKAGALLRNHPEFNEAPELDATAKDFYCMSWCPNHPDVNSFVFDLFDELLDAFQAKAFHVGMDEVFILGHCPRCKGKPNADLFAKSVNDLHSHLVGKRNVEMQMWGDRFLDSATVGCKHEWEGSANQTWPAVDMVPKDIVIADWHYEPWDGFPSVRFFLDKGFRVWPASWNNEKGITRFIEVARENASPGMLGYMATTWTNMTDVVAGLAGDPIPADNERLPAIIAGVKLGARLAQD